VIERAGAALPPHALMRRAGDASPGWRACTPRLDATEPNNGGDASKRLGLREHGKRAGDAVWQSAGTACRREGRPRRAPVASEFDDSADRLDGHDIAIDALLGIGASRPPQGKLAEACGRDLGARGSSGLNGNRPTVRR
jgi:NAD(P)H-hydrate repair Nnr-like enzyme with NAD(P)H-hydrate epimerase domain